MNRRNLLKSLFALPFLSFIKPKQNIVMAGYVDVPLTRQKLNPPKLEDLYISLEAFKDIESWNVSQVDEQTRKELFLNA